MNSVGRRVRDNKVLCCSICRYPVLLVGRFVRFVLFVVLIDVLFSLRFHVNTRHSVYNVPMTVKAIDEHVQSNERKKTFSFLGFGFSLKRCNESVSDIEKIEAKSLILCSFGGSQDPCLRGYTSQRDLQAHIKRRHESTRLDSPHQLIPSMLIESSIPQSPTITSAAAPPQTIAAAPPPPIANAAAAAAAATLLAFAPPLPPPPPPPIFDPNFRPGNFRLPPQTFVPPGGPFRGGSYPPPRSFY